MAYQAVSAAEFKTCTAPRKGVVAVHDVVLWYENIKPGPNLVDLGIYNRRPRRGLRFLTWRTASLHAVGRAWDIGWEQGYTGAQLLANLLVWFHDYNGVAEVIYARRRWTLEHSWQPYTGSDPHTTHIHVGFTVDFADNPSSITDLKKWVAHFMYGAS